jgi:hypothetical protein
MIRTLITPQSATLTFPIPKNYIGREMEVIAFTVDEGFKPLINTTKQVSFTVLHVENNNYKFNRDEANER